MGALPISDEFESHGQTGHYAEGYVNVLALGGVMKVLKWGLLVVLLGALGAAIMAPLGPMPGIWVSGSEQPVPETWGETRDIKEIQLQVGDGFFGRTVIIWMVQYEGNLFITGQKDSGWVSGIGASSPVTMKMNGNLYALTATALSENQVPVLTAWQQKYTPLYPQMMAEFPAPEEALATAVVYELSPR